MGFVAELHSLFIQSLNLLKYRLHALLSHIRLTNATAPDIVFGYPAPVVEIVRVSGRISSTPFTLLLKSFSSHSQAFASVQEYLLFVH